MLKVKSHWLKGFRTINQIPFLIILLISHLGFIQYSSADGLADVNLMAAESSTQEASIHLLTDRLRSVQSMTSNFIQQTRTADGSVLQIIEGQLDVFKPNRLRWQTTPPYEQLVIADGIDIWIYDQDLEQVTVRSMDNSLQETPALLLSGNLDNIADEYAVSAIGDEVFNLKPNDESQLFDRLTLIFSDNKIQSLTIFDATGQYTLIEFSNVTNNPITDRSIANDLFSFRVPEGVDIIDGR